MILDTTTVIAAAAFVAGMAGAFLLVAGGKLYSPSATTVWGFASLFTALSMVLILHGYNFHLAFLSMMVAGALAWRSASMFERRAVPLSYLVAGPAVWTFVVMGPWDLDFGSGAMMFLAITAVYFGAAAWRLWQGRSESLPSRWPLLVLIAGNAIAMLIAAVALARYSVPPDVPPAGALWVIYVGTVVFTVGTAVFFLAMTKERQVAAHEFAALTDSLTGVSNRHALMATGTLAVRKAGDGGRPISVAVFDLDHFKAINDTYGHGTGDVVLQRFTDLAMKHMRPGDLFGRVGGEEFVAIIPEARAEDAMDFAERIRVAFADESVWVDGKPLCATVSSGVAVMASDDAVSLDELLGRADAALYVAKASGRDCVSLSRAAVTTGLRHNLPPGLELAH